MSVGRSHCGAPILQQVNSLARPCWCLKAADSCIRSAWTSARVQPGGIRRHRRSEPWPIPSSPPRTQEFSPLRPHPLQNLSLDLSPLFPVEQNPGSSPISPQDLGIHAPLYPLLTHNPDIWAYSSHRPAVPRASSCMAPACFCPVAQIGSEVWSMCAAPLR